MRVTSRKFCSLVMAWCLERIEAEKREEWLFMMDQPLPGEMATTPHRPSKAELDKDAELFMANMRKMT